MSHLDFTWLVLQGIRPSLCARATHTAISVISSLSAPSGVDTVRLLKGLCTCKKGKAFNFLSLIPRVKLEIL